MRLHVPQTLKNTRMCSNVPVCFDLMKALLDHISTLLANSTTPGQSGPTLVFCTFDLPVDVIKTLFSNVQMNATVFLAHGRSLSDIL